MDISKFEKSKALINKIESLNESIKLLNELLEKLNQNSLNILHFTVKQNLNNTNDIFSIFPNPDLSKQFSLGHDYSVQFIAKLRDEFNGTLTERQKEFEAL